jgi:hypothetical protein
MKMVTEREIVELFLEGLITFSEYKRLKRLAETPKDC